MDQAGHDDMLLRERLLRMARPVSAEAVWGDVLRRTLANRRRRGVFAKPLLMAAALVLLGGAVLAAADAPMLDPAWRALGISKDSVRPVAQVSNTKFSTATDAAGNACLIVQGVEGSAACGLHLSADNPVVFQVAWKKVSETAPSVASEPRTITMGSIASITGYVVPEVARLRLLFDDGTSRDIPITDRAFVITDPGGSASRLLATMQDGTVRTFPLGSSPKQIKITVAGK